MLIKYKFKINGIHCKSCKTLIETELSDHNGIKNINVDHQTGAAEIEYDDQITDFKKISEIINNLNYSVAACASEKPQNNAKFNLIVLVIALFLLLSYFLINKNSNFEILSRLNADSVSVWLILLIGLLSSFHCIGMCGGIVISISAKTNQNSTKANLVPQFKYNLGRFVSYTIIGAILGGIGSFFGINPNFSGFLLIVAGVFMLLMSASFMFNFKWLELIKPKTPQFIARFIYKSKSNKSQTPFIIGLLTGFMPCGPLQSMQLFALATGSFISGALAMAIYSLGTIPLMFGFGALISKFASRYLSRIIKISAIIIALLGLIMINRGLINFGLGINHSNTEIIQSNQTTNNNQDIQEVKMDLTYSGYSPNVLYIKPGIKVRWIINVIQMTGCTDAIQIESLGIKRDLKIGENIIEFTPPANVKEIKFSCSMRMVWGKFLITK